MKTTITTLVLLTCASLAYAESISVNPFDFELTSPSWGASAGVTIADGQMTAASGNVWACKGGQFDLANAITLTNPKDTLDFSYTIKNTGSGNSVQGVALVGSKGSYVSGHLPYSAYPQGVQLTHTTEVGNCYVGGNGFTNGDLNDLVTLPNSYTDGVNNLVGAAPTNSETTININVSWVVDQFVMTLTTSTLPDQSLTLNLGSTFDVSSIVFTMVSGDGSCYIKDATLSANIIPEPTTATLSLLALAGLCARRRRK